MLVDEVSVNIDGCLCCNDCSKMLKVVNDPIYKTLNEVQQMMFKFVRLFPFPKTIKALKEELNFINQTYIHFNVCNPNYLNKQIF